MWELTGTVLLIPAGILCWHLMFPQGIKPLWNQAQRIPASSCKISQSPSNVFQGRCRISLADPTCSPFPEAQGWDHLRNPDHTITWISQSQELCLTCCGHLQLPWTQSHCYYNFHGFNPTAPPQTSTDSIPLLLFPLLSRKSNNFSTWNCFIRKRSINNKTPTEEERDMLLEGQEILGAKQIQPETQLDVEQPKFPSHTAPSHRNSGAGHGYSQIFTASRSLCTGTEASIPGK